MSFRASSSNPSVNSDTDDSTDPDMPALIPVERTERTVQQPDDREEVCEEEDAVIFNKGVILDAKLWLEMEENGKRKSRAVQISVAPEQDFRSGTEVKGFCFRSKEPCVDGWDNKHGIMEVKTRNGIKAWHIKIFDRRGEYRVVLLRHHRVLSVH